MIVQDLTISNPQIPPQPDLDAFRNSNLTGAGAGSGCGENLFWDHRTIHLMKLMASTMLSAALNRQYSSLLPLLCCQFLTKFVEQQLIFYFFPITLIKFANNYRTGQLR